MGFQIALVIGLMGFIGFLGHSWKVQIETNYAFKLEAELTKAAKNYQEDTARITGDKADEMHSRDIQSLKDKNDTDRTIRELTSNLERMAHEQPFKTGNLYELRLKRIMCKIATAPASDNRDSCDRFEASPEDYSPRFASIITITADEAEKLKEQCEGGDKDSCDYSIIGLTTQGATDLLEDLSTILYYVERLNSGEDARIGALIALRDLKVTHQPK